MKTFTYTSHNSEETMDFASELANKLNAKITDDEISTNVDIIPSVKMSSDVCHEDKIAKILNKYFGDKWVEYSIEEKTLDRISTEITLSITFKNNRKSNITLPIL